MSRSCRAPSSRSRQQRWSAREAARSTANFSCTARTRSAVGAVPFRPEEKKTTKKQKTSRDELSAVPPRLQNTHRSRLGAEEERRRKVSQTAPARLERTRILFTKVGARKDSGTAPQHKTRGTEGKEHPIKSRSSSVYL